MTNLSPQAQAVLDAFTGNDTIYGLHLMTPGNFILKTDD